MSFKSGLGSACNPIPKGDEAWWLIKRYPALIEATIERYPGRDIGQWYRGEMSSRKLLVLLENSDDEWPFKRHAARPFGRGGDWNEAEQMLAAIHEENALDRASKYVGGENEYVPKVFISPPERFERAVEAQTEAQQEEEQMDLLARSGLI